MDQTIITLIAHHGLPIVAVMVFVAELGLPTGISPKIALVIVGSTAIGSLPALIFGLALVTVANISGCITLHMAARHGGRTIARKLLKRSTVSQSTLFERCQARLGDREVPTIFVLRLTPLIRIYATIATGLAAVPLRRFVLAAAPAALIWSGVPLSLGFWFRGDATRFADKAPWISLASVVVLPIIGVFSYLRKRRRSNQLTAIPLPQSANPPLLA